MSGVHVVVMAAVDAPPWSTVVTGLGGALIGGCFVLFGGWRQGRSAREAARMDAKRDAYARLLAASAMVVHMADSVRLTKSVRSGLKEGLDVMTRARRPLDPMELYSFLRRDFEPLHRAWADVWAVGSPEAVRRANDLLHRASEVLGVNSAPGQRNRGLMWYLAGEAWTDSQLEAMRAEVVALANARRELGDLARAELGVEVADLFALS